MQTKETARDLAAEISEERVTQLLQELLRIRSVVGERTTAHQWVADKLRAAEMKVDLYTVEGSEAPMVLGAAGESGGAKGLLFEGHFDTVAATKDDWTHDPWGGAREGDFVYGRGAVDSKGSLVAMLAATEVLLGSGVTLRGPLYFLSDSDGERGMRGVALLRDLGVASGIAAAISGEGTENKRIEVGYPGISTWKITAVGRTAHPTEPEKGINAIAKMAKLVAAVDQGRLKISDGSSDWFRSRVTTNAIRTPPGAGWAIPARCDLVLSVMTPVGVDLADIREDIDQFLSELETEDGQVTFERKLIPMGAGRLWLKPGEVDPAHPAVGALQRATEVERGVPAAIGPFNGGWVDGAELMHQANSGDAPAVITFGPGEFDQSHAIDEHVRISEVVEAARIYARVAIDLLT